MSVGSVFLFILARVRYRLVPTLSKGNVFAFVPYDLGFESRLDLRVNERRSDSYIVADDFFSFFFSGKTVKLAQAQVLFFL